jgi:orotate phosphoribosyltransferase
MVVLLDREQGGQVRLRSSRIEPHVLFNISDAMSWLHSVGLISHEVYDTLKAYIEEESKGGQSSPA